MKMKHWFSRLRSYLIFFPLLLFYTALLGTLSLCASFFDKDGNRQHALGRRWARWILRTCMIPLEVEGLDNVDAGRAQLYIANHQSAMDIPIVYAALPVQFRILAKKELFSYPFLGWHLKRSGQILIDEKSATASMRSVNRTVDALRSGMPVLIFAEGGRSPDGRIMPFQKGAFIAAAKAQVEIVPMALVGVYELLPMNTYHVKPRPVQLIIGRPISTAGFSARDAGKLTAKTQNVIEDMYYARSPVHDPRGSAAEMSSSA